MPCFLLYAATGMGKTKILRKFRREHPTAFDDRAGIERMEVVAMQMPPEPDEKSFYTQLLSSHQGTSPSNGSGDSQSSTRDQARKENRPLMVLKEGAIDSHQRAKG
jgi:hypothetical protein